MNAITCDDPRALCVQGNLFRLNANTAPSPIEGRINGLSTGPLPHGERVILPNTLSGTTNRLDVLMGGTAYPLIDNLQEFNISRPEDVGVTLSEIPTNTSATSVNEPDEEALAVEVPASMHRGSPGEGSIDPETADNDTLLWVATVILVRLEAIDEGLGLQYLYEYTDGYVDLRSTGTDSAPAVADAIAALAVRNGRAAVRALLKTTGASIRVTVNSIGRLILVATLRTGVARTLAAVVLGRIVHSEVSKIVASARGQLGAPAVATASSRIPVIGIIIVGTINLVEWYANPESRGDWSFLISTMIVDGTALIISSFAAAALAAAVFPAIATVGAFLLAATVAITFGVAVGAMVTAAFRGIRATENLDSVLTAVHRGMRAIAQGAAELTVTFADWLLENVVEPVSEFVTHAQPGDGRITGPTDYLMELDRGVDRWIRNSFGLP